MLQLPRSAKLYKAFSSGAVATYSKGDLVDASDTDNHFAMVMHGFVKNYTLTKNGSSSVQLMFGKYDVFPLSKAYKFLLDQSIYDGPETYYCKAICDTRLGVISSSALSELVAADPSLYKDLFQEVGRHLKSCIHHMENMAINDTYVRVAHQLLYLSHEFGTKTANGSQISLELTHQDIAELVNVSRETATRAVMKLRHEGLLDTSGKHIIVVNLKQLHEVSYS